MVYVCDAIMGTGKTQACISYMNSHADKKFIYITPFLEEAKRIQKSCPKLHFIEPSNQIQKYDFRKLNHIKGLIEEGKNVATTHQAFKNYTPEMLEIIKEKEYTLVIDENVEIVERANFTAGDLKILVDAGYVEENNNTYTLTESGRSEVNEPGRYKDVLQFLLSRELVEVSEDEESKSPLYYWTLPPNLITSFKDVYILTYLFEGQGLYNFLKLYDIEYEYIGIQKNQDGSFEFGEFPGYIPEYVSNLKSMIKICDNLKLNEIGEKETALSVGWFKKSQNSAKVKRLKDNVYNYFRHINGTLPAQCRLWSTFKCAQFKIKGKGYSNSFLAFNTRATNAYKDTYVLAYALNIFMNVGEKLFYNAHGIKVDEKKYALSAMVQWIWRSAIRDGQTINIYIPSRRMREIFTEWINQLCHDPSAKN